MKAKITKSFVVLAVKCDNCGKMLDQCDSCCKEIEEGQTISCEKVFSGDRELYIDHLCKGCADG